MQGTHRSRTARIVAALGIGVVLVGVAPQASAQGDGVETLASGLDNPRGLAFAPNGALYVAEAGRGGEGPCFPGPEGTVCFGTSGAVTEIRNGAQRRVLSGLPSTGAEEDGSSAIGPSDVSFQGMGGMYVTVGLGADPAKREELPELSGMAKLVRAQLSQGAWKTTADIGDYEAEANPDGAQVDTNPNSVLAGPSGQLVVDAGGNALLRVSANRQVSTVAVFPVRLTDAPPFLGLPPGTQIPMDAVPTAVVKGPDGAYYVGELTGFPFPAGDARVYRVVPGQAPTVFADGFTNIIDIGFDAAGRLHVLEIAHNGLLSGDLTGGLTRVNGDGSKDLLMTDGLFAPGGLALRANAAYVSNCGVCPGAGSVLRIPLD